MTAVVQGRPGRAARASLTTVVVALVVFLPGAFDRWFLPKALLVAVAVLVACAAPAAGRLPRWAVLAASAGALVLLVAALTSAAPLAETLGRWPRYEGAVMLPVYFAVVWLGARLLGPAAPEDVRARLLDTAAAVGVVLAVVTVLEATGLRPLGGSADRPGALLGNASDQGLVAGSLLVLLALPAVEPVLAGDPAAGRQRLLRRVGVVASVLTLVLSGSRGALGAVVVGIVVLAVLALVRPRAAGTGDSTGPVDGVGRARHATPSRRLVLIGGAVLVAGIGIAALLLPGTRDRLTSADRLAGDSAADRLLIWHDALAAIATRPWLGLGPSGFEDAVARQHGLAWQRAVGSQTTLDSPHAWPLQAASAGGVVLLALAVATLVAAVMTGLRNRHRASRPEQTALLTTAPAVLAVAVVGLAVTFTTPGTVLLPALLAGAMVAVPASRRPAVPVARRWRAGLVAVWVAFLAVTTAAEVPLAAGVRHAEQGDARAADADFTLASRLRPWDADVASIAAQSMASLADGRPGGTPAARLTVSWAERSLRHTPDSLVAAKASAVGQLASGDVPGASATLRRLATRYPFDAQVAHRYGGVLTVSGDLDGARRELTRASRLAPDDRDVWLTLAYVQGQLGDEAAARTAQARADRLSGGVDSR